MDFLFSIPFVGPFLGVTLPFLLVLGVVIFVHEYGHYIVGRWSGIHAEVFSIGFGREIIGWDDRRGTRWRICWVPLGGYVKFKGDANAASAGESDEIENLSEEERRQTLGGAPLWARSATVAAGPIANFILTIVMVFAITWVSGLPSGSPLLGEVNEGGQAYGGGLRAGDRVISVNGAPVESYRGFIEAMFEDQTSLKQVEVSRPDDSVAAGQRRETLSLTFLELTTVARVTRGSPAAKACLAPGDVIQKIDGRGLTSFSELQEAVTASEGRDLTLTIERDGELLEKTLRAEMREVPDPATGGVVTKLLIGVAPSFNLGLQPAFEPVSGLTALQTGLAAPYGVVASTFGYLGQIFAGESNGSSLRGPLGIAEISGEAASQGFMALLTLTAILSTAIGLMNLFPIPILDGGHLVFYAIEGVRGRPLGPKAMEAAMAAGFIAIIALLVFATRNDVVRIYEGLTSGC